MAADVNPVHSAYQPSNVYMNELGLVGDITTFGSGAFGMGRAQLEVGGDPATGRATLEQEV